MSILPTYHCFLSSFINSSLSSTFRQSSICVPVTFVVKFSVHSPPGRSPISQCQIETSVVCVPLLWFILVKYLSHAFVFQQQRINVYKYFVRWTGGGSIMFISSTYGCAHETVISIWTMTYPYQKYSYFDKFLNESNFLVEHKNTKEVFTVNKYNRKSIWHNIYIWVMVSHDHHLVESHRLLFCKYCFCF